MMIATLAALASEEITAVAKAFASFTSSKAAQRRQKSEPISPQLDGPNMSNREGPKTKSRQPRCASLHAQSCRSSSLHRREWVRSASSQPASMNQAHAPNAAA